MAKKVPALTDEAIALIARRFAVLSEPMRLRLIQTLMAEELSVGALVTATGGTQANVSRHLQTLAEAGIVGRRKEGLQVFYSIADPTIYDLCELVCSSLEKQTAERASLLRGASKVVR
ncbi:MAG TPA: metalloregulator ArsR/SmtB family transcription factor [Opitutaceae bacterium]|nr:metalloregulator ArsR/SmtB family transcription factor [Opitutaceae bacterium]